MNRAVYFSPLAWLPLVLIGIVSLVGLQGCKDAKPCRDKTVLLALTFDQQTMAADSVDVTFTANGQSKSLGAFARTPNNTSDSLAIELATYEVGTMVTIDVVPSTAAGGVLGHWQAMQVLTPGCSRIALTVGNATVTTDSGMSDATPPDGTTPDADAGGTCIAGGSCPLSTAPCHVGRTVCTNGISSCMDTEVLQSNGFTCGTDMVCLEGACMTCAAGAACDRMVDCQIGRTSCTTGAPVCMQGGTAQDGTGCGGAGSGKVCAGGACVACANDASCTPKNACHKGTLTCAGGAATCNDTQAAMDDGTTCDVDKVCFQGACTACKVGMTCDLAGLPCKTGGITCNTGQPVCVDSGNAGNGKPCDAGKVCSDGACVMCVTDAPCVPTNKCHVGKLDCSGGTPSCKDTMANLDNGSTCGTDQVCNNGACATCLTDQDCTPSMMCKVGKTSCATGTSVCRQTGNATNGSTCGSGLVCSGGDCVTCAAGPCTPTMMACHNGTLSCANGTATCTDLNTNMMNGMVCGMDLVCKTGSCVTCKEDPCTPATCQVGKFVCATGSPVCTKTGNDMDGKGCGSNMVCLGGACKACMDQAPCVPAANPCHKGTQSCTTGAPVCVETLPAVNVTDGTMCGAKACAAGVCNCDQGSPCTPSGAINACKTGTTSCTSGSSACNPTGNVSDGATCAAGKSCTAGSCNAPAICASASNTVGCPCTTAGSGCDGLQPTVCAGVTGQPGLDWQKMGTACTAGTQTCNAATGTCMANAPGAPGNVSAMQAKGAAAVVSWTAPTGGAAVTGYTVTSSPGNKTATALAGATTATVSGLTIGTSYTFTVAAMSAGGNTSSAPSNSITAGDVPGAPTGVSAMAIAGNKATVTWTAAASNSNAITVYTVTSTPGNFTATSAASPATVSGLAAGTMYTFTVVATNGLGDGPGATSGAITAGSTPAAPTNVVATAVAGGKVNLSWTAPAGTVTQYSISSTPGGASLTTTGTTATISAAMVSLGTSYAFNVRADNAIGMGGTGVSNSVIVGDVPGAPTVTATTGPGLQALVSWTAPAAMNGYPITGYTIKSVTPAGISLSAAGNATSQVVLRLTQGTAYTFSVQATNALGNGALGTSNPITPQCSSNTRSIPASDTATIQYGSSVVDNSTNDLLNAAYGTTGGLSYDETGWAKFSLSTLPSWAVVTNVQILVAQEGSSGSPTLQIDYSASDAWTRAQVPTPAAIPRTTTVSGTFSPLASPAFQTITLVLGSHDFTGDLASTDLNLTLGVTNANHSTTFSQAYYDGYMPAALALRPKISITTCE